MKKFKGIMIHETSSDAGKSFIITGLCRVLSDMGYKVAPFKSQNIFHNDLFRNRWLNMVREKAGLPLRDKVDTTEVKERSFAKLAGACKKYLDMDAILKMMNHPV